MYTPKAVTKNGNQYEVDKFHQYDSGREYFQVSTKVNFRWTAVTGREAEEIVAIADKENKAPVYYKENEQGYIEKVYC